MNISFIFAVILFIGGMSLSFGALVASIKAKIDGGKVGYAIMAIIVFIATMVTSYNAMLIPPK